MDQGDWGATRFAARLRELRLATGMAQEALARTVNCAVGTISRLERGTGGEPPWGLVVGLARALGVSVAAFDAGATGENTTGGQEAPTTAAPEVAADRPKAKKKGKGAHTPAQ
jgi:transcriptional regulator with XRE-family HTH domain